ncbi:hypothetical protein M3Y95_01146800 [Aphelenchoides besseyi]|nr:hypothetical protein M3Y95_01146800 [Aphelenchoides besseyi]
MDDDDSSGNAGDADHEFSPDLDVSGTMNANTSTDDAASYADRSDFSLTPPSDAGKSTERKSRRPTNSNTTNDREQRRKRSSGDDQRKSRSKRRLNDLALEQRLMALTEENQRLKVQLGANSGTQNMSSKSSVIVAAPSSTTGTSILHHPLPSAASGANAIFGLSNVATTTSVTPIQSAGSAFSIPRTSTTFGSSSITSTLTEQPNPNAFSSLFYSQQNDNLSALGLLAPSHAALLSLFNPTTQSTDRINGSAFLSSPLVQTPATPGTSGFDLPLASLANLQAILQQQQQQQALIPNFASTTPASATDPNPVDLGLQFLPSTIFASQFDRRSTETQPTSSTNAVCFNSLFHPTVSTSTNEPKKTVDVNSSNDRTTPTLSLNHQPTNGTSKSVTRG